MALTVSGKKISFSPEKLTKLFSNYYSYLLLLLIILLIGFGAFMAYQTVFDTLVVEKTINPQDIQSKEEKINLERYTSVSKLLNEKKEHATPTIATTF